MRHPILFIPGLACGAGQWRREAEHYGASRETAVFELPRRSGLSVEGHVHALDAKIEQLRWERAILVGHSLGGNLAAVYARQRPHRVESVVLVDPTGDLRDAIFEEPEDYAPYLRAWFEDLLGPASAETRERVLADLAEIPGEVFFSTLEAYRDFDFTRILEGRLGATLCVDGEGPKGPSSFQRLYPELERRTLPNVGHWPHLDAPEAFRKALEGFSSL
jgi:pimeloyl-ACP methyl ester carboxylesterase